MGAMGRRRLRLEVKARGSQVVAPPSIHPGTGRAYVWLDERPCAWAPAWLLRRPAPARTAAAADHLDPLRRVPADVYVPLLTRRNIERGGYVSCPLHEGDNDPSLGFTNAHARTIAHVVRLLCGVSRAPSVVQETAGIVGTFLHGAVAVEGFTTYGQTSQRYDALVALRREREQKTGRYTGDPRFLVDKQTGEFVIRVSDLQAAAREHTGSSVPHGWLDARMEHLGWRRCRLEGYGLLGRAGRRQGPHARADVYRGHLPASPDDDEGVTT